MQVNRKVFFTVLIILGLLVGVASIWAYREYKDDILNYVGIETSQESDSVDEVDIDIPFVASDSWDFGSGKDGEWWFYIFQPKVVEYKTVDGLNYAVVEYSFTDEVENDLSQVDVLLSRENEWSLNNSDLNQGDFENAIAKVVRFESFEPTGTSAFDADEDITFESLQEKVPVGDRIAISVPLFYPDDDARTSDYCAEFELLCSYGSVWDVLSYELGLFNQNEIVSDEFVIVPYSVSDTPFVWSEDGI